MTTQLQGSMNMKQILGLAPRSITRVPRAIRTILDRRRLIPPPDLMGSYSGASSVAEFVAVGEALCRLLIDGARLQPHHKILDVGCGIGKAARPLTKFLNSEGRYEGFDVGAEAITWCRATYQTHPNFRFHHADIFSKAYNPTGAYRGYEYRFPYADQVFDAVLLASVFTHMVPRDLEQYLSEIARVLKRQGRSVISYFLLTPDVLENVERGLTTPGFPFVFDSERCRVTDRDMPEAAVAYDEEYVAALYRRHGLVIQTISHGQWGSGQLIPHNQDIVIAMKAV